jgi:hypothetical protein
VVIRQGSKPAICELLCSTFEQTFGDGWPSFLARMKLASALIRLPKGGVPGESLLMSGRNCYHYKPWIEEGKPHDCWTTTEAALTSDHFQ